MSSTESEDALRKLTNSANFERLQKDVEAVKHDINALADQITDALSAFTGEAQKQARRTYKRARSNVEGALADASERGSDALDAASDYAATLEESLEDAIVQRPLAAVGLAVGLGFLIGVTWRR